MKVCPLEDVQCQYHDIGCKAKVARKDLAKHDEEKTNDHLLLMKSALTDAQNKLADTKVKLANTETRLVIAEVKLASTELKLADKQKAKLFDTMFGEWPIKIHTQAAKLSSCNQLLPVIVKLPDFVMKVENNVDWYSDPFYTHRQGYKMRLNVVPAGWGDIVKVITCPYICISWMVHLITY